MKERVKEFSFGIAMMAVLMAAYMLTAVLTH